MASSRGCVVGGSARMARASILVEVLVAIVILGVFLGGLSGVFLRSMDAAVKLRGGAGGLATSLLSDGAADAWTWGPMVDGISWDAGPVLGVSPGVGCLGEIEVGIWADGWLLGEWTVHVPEELVLTSSTWEGAIGSEVVVRARKGDGGWGAPWRTVVPDEYGYTAEDAKDVVAEADSSALFLEAKAVSHLRNLGATGLMSSPSTNTPGGVVEGLVVLLADAGSGVCVLESYDRRQSWIQREDRHLDVFW